MWNYCKLLKNGLTESWNREKFKTIAFSYENVILQNLRDEEIISLIWAFKAENRHVVNWWSEGWDPKYMNFDVLHE